MLMMVITKQNRKFYQQKMYFHHWISRFNVVSIVNIDFVFDEFEWLLGIKSSWSLSVRQRYYSWKSNW